MMTEDAEHFVLVIYDQMCRSITECERVDEAKDIRDKAKALEAYWKQANNVEAELAAARIRLRAERQCGLLLKQEERAHSPNPHGHNQHQVTSSERTQPSPYADTLTRTGMSRQTASRLQQLADVPEDQFERSIASPTKQSLTAVVEQARPPRPEPEVSNEALWLWGSLRDWEKGQWLDADPVPILQRMTDLMREDVFRLAPRVAEYLNALEGNGHERQAAQ